MADKYSIPLLTDFIGQLSGCQIFSSTDLFKSYHQNEIAAEDIHKTAMITPVGNYAYKRLPMGLRSAGSTFQRFMRGIPNCFTYIDEILLFSENREKHLKHLSQVFNRLDNYGLILNKEKCIFQAPQLDFLGHRVSAEGVKLLDAKVAAILDFPRPHTVRDLTKFLGMVNFYRRFIPNAGGLVAPLQCIVSPKKTSRQKLTWGPEAEKAFQTVKTPCQLNHAGLPHSGR